MPTGQTNGDRKHRDAEQRYILDSVQQRADVEPPVAAENTATEETTMLVCHMPDGCEDKEKDKGKQNQLEQPPMATVKCPFSLIQLQLHGYAASAASRCAFSCASSMVPTM